MSFSTKVLLEPRDLGGKCQVAMTGALVIVVDWALLNLQQPLVLRRFLG